MAKLKGVLFWLAVVGMALLVVFAAAFICAAIEIEPKRPTGCAGRNPPAPDDDVDRNGCARRQKLGSP